MELRFHQNETRVIHSSFEQLARLKGKQESQAELLKQKLHNEDTTKKFQEEILRMKSQKVECFLINIILTQAKSQLLWDLLTLLYVTVYSLMLICLTCFRFNYNKELSMNRSPSGFGKELVKRNFCRCLVLVPALMNNCFKK